MALKLQQLYLNFPKNLVQGGKPPLQPPFTQLRFVNPYTGWWFRHPLPLNARVSVDLIVMFKFKGRTLFAMPPYHITKQKVLHFSIFLGKEIKLKNEGGGNFSSWRKEYTPLYRRMNSKFRLAIAKYQNVLGIDGRTI